WRNLCRAQASTFRRQAASLRRQWRNLAGARRARISRRHRRCAKLMETGGQTHPDRLWIGAIPAGLVRSDDRGETWQLVSSLWNVPERKRWFGGGYDAAGIHSVSPDPRDDDRLFLAISCGGVWESNDAGESWSVLGKGLFAPYVPPEHAEDSAIQDPHRVVRCASAPDVMWMQHHAGIYRSADA